MRFDGWLCVTTPDTMSDEHAENEIRINMDIERYSKFFMLLNLSKTMPDKQLLLIKMFKID